VGEERRIQSLGGEPERKKRDHFEDPAVDGRIILRWFFRKCENGLDRAGSG
jgi:hypothetical protein